MSNTLNFEIDRFYDCQKLINNLNESIKKFQVIQGDPDNYIYDHFSELNRQVDLRRDTLIQEIQECSNKMIDEIATAHKACLEVAKIKIAAATPNIEALKSELDLLVVKCESLRIKGQNCEEFISNCLKLSEKINPILDDSKHALSDLKTKNHELFTQKVEINEIFGKLVKEVINFLK